MTSFGCRSTTPTLKPTGCLGRSPICAPWCKPSTCLVLVTPEYNGSVSGLLANAVDWLSRPHRASVLHTKPVLVLSASPSPSGGARAAGQLRAALTRIGATVLPAGLSVPAAHFRLGASDPDPQTVADLTRLLDDALDSLPSSPAALRPQGAA